MVDWADIRQRLWLARQWAGLSQVTASALSGVGEKSISSFETGSRFERIKLKHLEALLDTYGITLADFFSEGWPEDRASLTRKPPPPACRPPKCPGCGNFHWPDPGTGEPTK